jgi:hypothetical protein
MRKKRKLALIDNYVNIFRILYRCKINLIFAKSEDEIFLLDSICSKLLKLKDEHEKLFKQIHIHDNSFLLLKQQLETSLNNTTPPSTLPFSNIFLEKTNNVEKTLNKLKPSIKKY